MELCETCANRDTCSATCKPVDEILHDENRVMERHYQDRIVSYPMNKEIRFSEMEESRNPDGRPTSVEDFCDDDRVQFSSGDYRLRKTAVFVDRFFNRISSTELANKFDVDPNTIICIYRDAVKQLEKIIEALDSRKAGLKAVNRSSFSEHQKWFMLNQIFGFSCVEIAKMFGQDHKTVHRWVKLQSDKLQSEK